MFFKKNNSEEVPFKYNLRIKRGFCCWSHTCNRTSRDASSIFGRLDIQIVFNKNDDKEGVESLPVT